MYRCFNFIFTHGILVGRIFCTVTLAGHCDEEYGRTVNFMFVGCLGCFAILIHKLVRYSRVYHFMLDIHCVWFKNNKKPDTCIGVSHSWHPCWTHLLYRYIIFSEMAVATLQTHVLSPLLRIFDMFCLRS